MMIKSWKSCFFYFFAPLLHPLVWKSREFFVVDVRFVLFQIFFIAKDEPRSRFSCLFHFNVPPHFSSSSFHLCFFFLYFVCVYRCPCDRTICPNSIRFRDDYIINVNFFTISWKTGKGVGPLPVGHPVYTHIYIQGVSDSMRRVKFDNTLKEMIFWGFEWYRSMVEADG